MLDVGTSIEVGDLIDGRYQIISPLGEGGMGTVYRAKHVGIKRDVAIKFLHEDLRGDQNTNARIMREAFATGRLAHPNCVAITDSGTLEDGATYLVMELLPGKSLGDELEDKGTLGVMETLVIAQQVLQGLAHAHEAGVVHRDLKPENIFLSKQGDGDVVVKILDFGIAKLVGEAQDEGGDTDITQAGMAIGSPTYMSPEQATGAALDGRTDLYSLSLVLYEMIVGEPPFFEPDDKMRSLKRRLTEVPPVMVPPAGERIPTGVELMIRHGLATMPGDRIASAQSYLERVQDLLTELSPADTVIDRRRVHPPTPSATHADIDRRGPTPAAPQPRVAPSPADAPASAARLTARQKRNAMIAGGAVLSIALIATLGTGAGTKVEADEEEKEKPTELVIEPEAVSETQELSKPANSKLQNELAHLRQEVAAGRATKNIKAIQKLQLDWPEDPRTNQLLGMAYMEKRFWQDGFRFLRKALSLAPELREDPAIIKAGIRALTSKKKPYLAVRFLVRDVGEPAIPFLEEAATGGTDRQRDFASRALKQLDAANL